jgi:lysophospholipase L1-like esterase
MNKEIKKQLVAWAVCAAILLAVEAGLRMRLGEGEPGILQRMGFRHQTEFDRQTDALKMAAERGRQVFLIGDSTMGSGFDATLFARLACNPGLSARNLAYGGMTWETKLATVKAMRANDGTVLVIGTAYFSAAQPMYEHEAFNAAFVERDGDARRIFFDGMGREEKSFEHRLAYLLARCSTTYMASAELRKFARHLFCFPTWNAPKFEPWTTPEFCDWSRASGGNPPQADEEARPEFRRDCRAAFFLEEIVRTASAKGMKVILVNMPVTRREMEKIAEADYKNYIDFLRELAASRDGALLFLDMNRGLIEDDGNYIDDVHLNEKGRSAFTAALGDHIVKAAERQRDEAALRGEISFAP